MREMMDSGRMLSRIFMASLSSVSTPFTMDCTQVASVFTLSCALMRASSSALFTGLLRHHRQQHQHSKECDVCACCVQYEFCFKTIFCLWAFLKHFSDTHQDFLVVSFQIRTVRKPANVVSPEDLLIEYFDFKNSGLGCTQVMSQLTPSFASAARLVKQHRQQEQQGERQLLNWQLRGWSLHRHCKSKLR